MKLFTIGFTKKSAETFFTLLQRAGVKRLIDVRLNNTSQLAGFTKKDDLAYFTKAICGIEYVHMPDLAPTPEILDAYKKQKGDAARFEHDIRKLLRERHIEDLPHKTFDHACLLCGEEKPEHCHRRVVADYLQEKWGDVQIEHML